MTKVTIVSGFLGAGKTTLIRKMIEEVFKGEKIVLIENEYGEIGIDGGFLKDAGVTITEMNSGCICCTLVGDFTEALQQVIRDFAPDRIIIEPSGVGKLSDIIAAVEKVKAFADLTISERIAVVDAKKAKIYMKNFGEFFANQVQYASTVILSRTQLIDEAKLEETVALLRTQNAEAPLITTPWDELSADAIRHAFERSDVENLLLPIDMHDHDDDDDDDECECHHHHHHDENDEEHECCHHHHHDDDDDEEHEHHHHHHHHDGEECDDPECECHHHHHDHDDDDDEEEHECHHHHHHDDDDEHECCHHHEHHHDEEHEHHGHEHHHHHHHHPGEHDADEVFTSWGRESAKKYSEEELARILKALADESGEYGQIILRAKGIIPMTDGSWRQFDMVPEESEVRTSGADYTGRVCVIGCELKEEKLAELFGLK